MTEKRGLKILVCGGRDFSDRVLLFKVLDEVVAKHGPPEIIIHGGASGADSLAGAWAQFRHFHVAVFPANWKEHGRAAGFKRNQRMIEEKPDLVVAFPGGRGTAHMLLTAAKAKVEVLVITARKEEPKALAFSSHHNNPTHGTGTFLPAPSHKPID